MMDDLNDLFRENNNYHNEYRNSDVIAINEGQFFNNLYSFVKKSVDIDKKL